MSEVVNIEVDVKLIRAELSLEWIAWANVLLAQGVVSQSFCPRFLRDMHDCWDFALTFDETGQVACFCRWKPEQLHSTRLQGEDSPDLDADINRKFGKSSKGLEWIERSWDGQLREGGQEVTKAHGIVCPRGNHRSRHHIEGGFYAVHVFVCL
jgi:hypothetical protein